MARGQKGPKIAAETMEHLDPSDTLRGFEKRAAQERPLGLLIAEARRRGYTPGKRAEDAMGYRRTFRATEDILPPKGSTEAPVRELSFEMTAQSFTKQRSKERAGIMTVTLQAGDNRKRDDIFLEAPDGNFSLANEFVVTDDKVIRAHSEMTAFRTCVTSSCSYICRAALDTCSSRSSLVSYILCVASSAVCTGCVYACQACAACNDRWWCRWVVGRCKQ